MLTPHAICSKKRQGQYLLKTPQARIAPALLCPSQPLSLISLDAPGGLTSVQPAPRRNKAQKKQQPKDIPVQIFSAPPPASATCPPVLRPPPPPPPPTLPPPMPPTAPPPPVSEDAPMPLSEEKGPAFPARNTLKQNIGEIIDGVEFLLNSSKKCLLKV